MKFVDRLKHGWNAFMSRDPTTAPGFGSNYTGVYYSRRPDRPRLTRGSERTILTSILNRIALDAASVDIRHVRLDENERYIEDINSGLNNCLTLEANIDQSARAFKHDVYLSLLDEGYIAVVPVETTSSPIHSNMYDVLNMRVGKIIKWMPQHVTVQVYNERVGEKQEVTLPKKSVAILENPFYAVMNEPNSTMQRLIRKLSLLDAVDEQSSAGKLDLIIQLPYAIKSEARRQQAEARRGDIEKQLAGSKYGIAYTDGTERITQLNRPLENNLLKQIEYLTSMLYSQLNINQEIMNGTADEKVMLNYNTRTVEPVVSTFVDALKRTFLSKTARTRRQSISFFTNPFRLVPASDLAEIADKMTRNEIMSSNEFRQIMGLKPSIDPRADELRNKNISSSEDISGEQYPEGYEEGYEEPGEYYEEEEIQNE